MPRRRRPKDAVLMLSGRKKSEERSSLADVAGASEGQSGHLTSYAAEHSSISYRTVARLTLLYRYELK